MNLEFKGDYAFLKGEMTPSIKASLVQAGLPVIRSEKGWLAIPLYNEEVLARSRQWESEQKLSSKFRG